MSCFDDGMLILCEWVFFVLFLVLYFGVGLDFLCVAFEADRTILRVFACFEAGYEMGLLLFGCLFACLKMGGLQGFVYSFFLVLSLLFGLLFPIVVFWMGRGHFCKRQAFIWYLHVLLMDVKWIFVALICYPCIHMDFTGVYGHLFTYFSYIGVCDLLFLDVVIIFLPRFSFCILMLLDRRSPGYHVFACLLLSN